MNKLCRNALASCLTVSLAVGGGIAVPAASTASLEQDTAVAGMAVSLDNYYASSQTPEADIMDYIRYIVSAAKEKKAIPVVTVNAVTKKDGSVVFGTSLVSEDASEQEEGLVSVMASLNVRNKPSVSSSVIGYLYSNCVVSIYDTVENDEGSWYLIKSGAVEGYVSSDYVLTGAAAKASEEDLTNRYAKVTANSTTVYSSASSSADSVGTVYKGGDYKVLEIQNGFVKIAVNEEFAGFVRAKDVSLYTRHAEAVTITDDMVKKQLDSYLVDIRDAEAIFEKRMAIADYQAAYNASTYAYQLWEYYISDASNAGYTDLVTNAKSEQKKTAEMVARATAALNGETIPETSSEAPATTSSEAQTTSSKAETSPEESSPASSTSPEETSPTQPDSSPADQTEPTTPTTVEDTTSTTAEETTSTTVENTTSTTAEETTSTTVEETTSTTAEETTSTTAQDTTSQEAVKSIQSIEAYYTGSSKTEGEVISASELYIVVTYTDGTTQTVTEGWSCDQVGMKLSAGVNIITVNYQGFSSSFEVNVATIAPSSDTPVSTSPDETSSETVPDDTTASVEEPTSTTAEETQPSSSEQPTTSTTAEETTTTTVEETTTTTTAEETTTTTVEETTTTTTAEETTTTTTAEETTTTVEETTTPSNNSTPLRDAIVNYALSWVGQCNYVYGGTDLSIGGSVDCSGFTMQVYSRVAGVSLPHHSMSQMNYGSAITYDQLRPGDLVFYNNPNHVAIYIGNGAIVHAGSPETGINVTSVFFKTPIGYRTYLP